MGRHIPLTMSILITACLNARGGTVDQASPGMDSVDGHAVDAPADPGLVDGRLPDTTAGVPDAPETTAVVPDAPDADTGEPDHRPDDPPAATALGFPCAMDSECASGFCEPLWVEGETFSVCAVDCYGFGPCPEGTWCYVPGDVAGACLLDCEGGCPEGLTCTDMDVWGEPHTACLP